MPNLRQKLLTGHDLKFVEQSINAHTREGWQLLHPIAAVSTEVLGADTTRVTIFMGPVIMNAIPYLRTGYAATVQIDVDKWREQQFFKINASEAKFLATRLHEFSGHNCANTIVQIAHELAKIDIYTVEQLFRALPAVGSNATSKASPLVKLLGRYAKTRNTGLKGPRRREADEKILRGWFEDLKRFNVVVHDQLTRFQQERVYGQTLEPH
jgi:hypothetical protein